MNDETCYVLTDWHRRNETYESRRLKSIGWFAMPTTDFTSAWGEIVSDDDGAEVAGCWLAFHYVAAAAAPRGMLIRHNGKAHDPKSLAAATRLPEPLVRKSLARLLDLGLIREHPMPIPGVPAESAGVPAESAGDRPTNQPTPPTNQPTPPTDRPTNRPATNDANTSAGAMPPRVGANFPWNRGGDGGGGQIVEGGGGDGGGGQNGDATDRRSDTFGIAVNQVGRTLARIVPTNELESFTAKQRMLRDIGMKEYKVAEIAKRRDVTPAALEVIIREVKKDPEVTNVPGVVVTRLNARQP